jgi:hypothetical protein
MQSALTTAHLPNPEPLDEDADTLAVDYPEGAPLLVRRSFLTAMNYFDEHFGQHWWDLELCWRIRRSGKRIIALPKLKLQTALCPSPDMDPVMSADLAIGAACYVSKHYGTGAGVALRLRATLFSLGHVVTFRSAGFHLKRMIALISGQKVDGTQE